MNISVLGIDTAKHVFHLCGMNRAGKPQLKKKVGRKKLIESVLQSGSKTVAMEACGGSYHWAREFESHGLKVKLIPPQYVKPYVKSNKTDFNDAEAIAEAASRPTMRFVSIKTTEQQDLQAIHRVRERYIKHRTALSNEARGLLHEHGIVIAKGYTPFKKFMVQELQDSPNLSRCFKTLMSEIYEEFVLTESRIKCLELRLTHIANSNPVIMRLMAIPGVGLICATGVVAAIGTPKDFKNGRCFASWLGLTPREYSSGGKQKLFGITKRGNSYLRRQLVHGARSIVYHSRHRSDPQSLWIQNLRQKAGNNKTVIAFANKTARIIWNVMANDTDYQPRLAY
jgi:transposase